MTIESEREFLVNVVSRAKRRRLNLGLPEKGLSPFVLDEPKHAQAKPVETSSNLKPLQQRKALAYGQDYVPSEETLRTDLAQEYVNSGRRPQNFISNAGLETRFEEFPKLKRLISLHSDVVADHAIQPTYLNADLRTFDLTSLLPTRFDCIVVDPPVDLSWEVLGALPIPSIASTPSFIWLWCGPGNDDGLEKGRALLAKWGYRRCEDIVWLKTNRTRPDDGSDNENLFTQTKEHCLQGIRGTVRRSTDADFVHCNVDIDVIAWEGDPQDPHFKPPELLKIVENFCLGNRRLHIGGSSKSLRPGWLTIGQDLDSSEVEAARAYDKDQVDSFFVGSANQVVPNTPEVDALRPKSPPPRGGGHTTSGGGIGRGRGGNGPRDRPAPMQQHHSLPINPMRAQNAFSPPPAFTPTMPPGMFNPMAAMFNPMLMNPGGMDWTAFFQNQQQR